jgi:hypothetical protein
MSAMFNKCGMELNPEDTGAMLVIRCEGPDHADLTDNGVHYHGAIMMANGFRDYGAFPTMSHAWRVLVADHKKLVRAGKL